MVCSNNDNGGEKGSDSGLLSEMQKKRKEKQVLGKDQYAFFKCPRIDTVLFLSTGVKNNLKKKVF